MGISRKQTRIGVWPKKYRPPLTPSQAGMGLKTPAVKPALTRCRYFISYIHSKDMQWGMGNFVVAVNPSTLVQFLADATDYIRKERNLTTVIVTGFQKIDENDWLPEVESE